MATKQKEIMRLLQEGVSQNSICKALHCSKRDVSKAARMLKETGISEEALAELSEHDVRQLLQPEESHESLYVEPDFERVVQELARPGVTRKLLWYRHGNTVLETGKKLYSYQQFCRLIDRHLTETQATMHLTHEPGRILYLD